VEELLERTGATRTTLRLDRPGAVFPVAAEALAPGARSIRDETGIDLRKAATVQFLEREQRNLIQGDCGAGDYPAPPELIELYGVKAQMLAPIVRDGRLAGIVSVHYAPSTREWSAGDVEALDDAARRVLEELEG
jgi:GAF domain-containing protein